MSHGEDRKSWGLLLSMMDKAEGMRTWCLQLGIKDEPSPLSFNAFLAAVEDIQSSGKWEGLLTSSDFCFSLKEVSFGNGLFAMVHQQSSFTDRSA